MASFNPIAHWVLSGMESNEEQERKMRARIAETAINAQKLQDQNMGPETGALDPYHRYESRSFNKYQFKLSALKNTEHGVVCSWKAAAAYAGTEQETRDAMLAKIKVEKEVAASS